MKKHNIISKEDGQGVWWHPGNKGPLNKLPYVFMFGSMKFCKVRMDYSMYPHTLPGIGIRFIHSGKYRWVAEGREFELLPDDMSIVNSWQLFGSPSGKTDIGEFSWMVIQPVSFSLNSPLNLGEWTKMPQKLQEDLGNRLKAEKVIIMRNAKKFKKYFLELKRELKGQKAGYEIIAENLIDNFFIELYRHLSETLQQTEVNDNFIDILTKIISDDLTLNRKIEDLALQFGMGKTKFTDEVKKQTGYPPAAFIINLRINKSIKMLSEGKYNLSQIAYNCGFSSLQHFNRTFLNRIGISPGEYKKSQKN